VETSTIVWIIVGIVVVIAIVVVVVLMTSRRRREAQIDSERNNAAELRQSAYESDVARREREAEAARAAAAAKQADADAMKAKLESDRLARESASHQSDAQELHAEVDERLRKADDIDPDVRTDRHDDATAPDRATGRDDAGRDETVRDARTHDERDLSDRERAVEDTTQRRDTDTGRRI
jgi:FtsZ-interacting cell division protein ZipA